MKTEKIIEHVFANEKEFRDFLDNAPNPSWLQNRDLGGKNHSYIPIFLIEANADLICRYWSVVDEKVQAISNGVSCTVKVCLLPDYEGAEERIITGSAGVMFAKSGNHLEFAVPNARERAIAKAFATMGNIFGRSLNRSYTVNKGGQDVKVIIKPDFSFRNKETKKDESK